MAKTRMAKDPQRYAEGLGAVATGRCRVLGLDLGTNCGVAVADIQPKQDLDDVLLVLGQWDLSVGPYDTGPIRHVRLRQFLELTQPDLIAYENVMYDPPMDLIKGRGMKPAAIVARVVPAAEFIGGLKVTVTSWAEEQGIPAQGFSISQIKKEAVGGRANKVDVINACNARFGTNLDPENYKNTGDDNIADAAFACWLGLQYYKDGLTCQDR